MEKTWRWFGKNDSITLDMLRQIGVEGIVTALYEVPPGEIWTYEAIIELKNHIDSERFTHVQSKLKIQSKDAVWWKDACLLYFQTYSGMPIPYDIERPVHEHEELKKIKLDLKHHN